MITVHSFCFNSFEENTYILFDETKECILIDPGNHLPEEDKILKDYIEAKQLNPVRLLNTHCHIDHILGNHFVQSTYQTGLLIHKKEIPVLDSSVFISQAYQIQMTPSPEPSGFLEENDFVRFGNSELRVIFTPGHSPGSISFFSEKDKLIISGDVLFERSIGRTDLPGGDYDTLISSITQKLFPLGDDVIVYPGHGNKTTLREERKFNPFLREHLQD